MTVRPLLLLVLLGLPMAQAQTTDPSSEVEIALTGAPDSLPANGNATVTVAVELTIRNIICTASETTTVSLTLAQTATVPGLTATLLASSLDYEIPMGNHIGQGYSDTQETTLTIETTAAVANATQGFNVTAEFGGGAICNSVGNVPSAEATEGFGVTTQAAPPPPMDEDEGGGGGGGGGIPGPGLPLTLLAVLALAFALRRRR
jgi:hypothetical protein